MYDRKYLKNPVYRLLLNQFKTTATFKIFIQLYQKG